PGKERFHKSQHFDISNGVPMLAGSEKPGIGGEPLVGQKNKPKYSVYPKGEGSGQPSWVALDKQVLCFDAYFGETVPAAQNETYRIRKCKIYFYLEDDTIQVEELKCKNSGIPQRLIHRQRIPLPPPKDDEFYNIFHFNINQEIVFYSRTFTVTNCDFFTTNFLTKLGVCLNDPVAVPDDPYSKLREQSMKPLRPYERRDTMRRFLDNDGKILRFYCFWDDTNSTFGDPREFALHYYLADDTIEIFERIPPNSGRDSVPKFLRRSKLPKQPGEITERTMLNVLDSKSLGNRFMLDNLRTGASSEEFYKDSDLLVGGELNVWGRRMIITDCDEFTKLYYHTTYGIEDFTPVQYKDPPPPMQPKLVPPYNGFGSEEDSLSSCQGLVLKPPQKDFHKFMEKDSNVLNFRAKMLTNDPVDRERVFIISFYLSDDSMSVFEQPQKNSVLGGKFLKRCRVKKPGQELFKSKSSEYFTSQDLYVGATVCVSGINLQLLDADEYTLNYMEQHAEEFPKANTGNILSKLQSIPEDKQSEIRKFLSLSDPTNTGFIPYESLALLMDLDCDLTEHEVLVLARSCVKPKKPEQDVGLILAMAQDLLKKKHFQDYPSLARVFLGRLPTKEMRTICRAFKLPLPENLREDLLNFADEAETVDYHAFLAGINWTEHPAPPIMPADILR
uniref:EF-hand domain (C-terminal) containing 2 n=1 Tax=Kryptolebias marmoratus TaxID=37003 RepID=A0A3Q3FMN1_KRYMA